MKKDSLICFRASKELQESLVRVAKADRRSLSSMIEMILTNYINEKKELSGLEMRKHPRKAISVPAVIRQQELNQIRTGTILDISLSGMKILIPKEYEQQVINNSKGSRFEVIFNLPNKNEPVKMSCESIRVIDGEDRICVGASFVDDEFKSYKSLHTYLM